MNARQAEARLGLTVKRRPHFTNTYGPFCPDCGQINESRKALQTHLAMAHGKRLAHYKLREGTAVFSGVSRPINVENFDLKGNLWDDGWLPDMKRIWRLSAVGHSDLILVERITRKAPKKKALYPTCLMIVLRGVEEAITTAPGRIDRATEYVRDHVNLVRRIQEQQRYSRLKTVEAKARLLALGLANPTVSLTYAERAEANSRQFTKKERITHYASSKAKHP